MQSFDEEKSANIISLGSDKQLNEMSRSWIERSGHHKYAYNFTWLGRPIIQLPQDIVAMQELIWTLKPDLIVETGIAHGGSLIFSASMLELNAASGGPHDARVLGIDIDIRAHNRAAIEKHAMFKRIDMIQGSSVDPQILRRVGEIAKDKKCVIVSLDSNHTHDHVLAELEGYSPLVTVGSYCVVFDTIVEDMPAEIFSDRPWGPGNSPKTAVRQFVKAHPGFTIDKQIDQKLMISVAPGGYLKRVK